MRNNMEMKELQAKTEAILFTLGEAVELERIALAVGSDEETVRQILYDLADRYNDSGSGIQLIELNNSFQLCTKPAMYEVITKITHVPKKQVLTDVLLETLSIIAYKQPITKVEIEAIRGVKCDHAVNKLIEHHLVCEVGRKNTPGSPIVFGTTEEFLRNFGIKSLEDLPMITPEKVEDFKQEANEEMELTLIAP